MTIAHQHSKLNVGALINEVGNGINQQWSHVSSELNLAVDVSITCGNGLSVCVEHFELHVQRLFPAIRENLAIE